MKKIFWLLSVFLVVMFLSCETVPVKHYKKESWTIKESNRKKYITLSLLSVDVDKLGGWDSIEKEAASLSQLYLWNRKCKVVPVDENPAYAAKINLREREFNPGWNSKRSLVAEVRVWSFEDAPGEDDPIYKQKLPVAAARIIGLGHASFSSAHVTSRLLSRTIAKTARKLLAYDKKQNKRQKNDT